ncbi:MAG: type II/IV secretion system protein [Bacilli bacterium]|nr:type II/IV secretion system protein [Bacilli bacterium]
MQSNIDFANTPVVDAVNKIIVDSARAGASDIHFDHSDNYLKVRIRIDGILNDYVDIPNNIKNNVITRIKILSGMNITETRLPQDGAIKTTLEGLDLDMRVSSLPTKKGEKIVIRILDYSRSLQGIEYLFFSEDNYKKVLKMLADPNGIILITGATGSGKSTTVYSFLQKLNVKGTNLITVEDPVEMDIEGINQVQVNSEIGLDFATVLRSILRQDPNVIMIGEIRDSETAQIAVRASITGHLVLSTLHTNNSLTTIERLLDMDVERYLLASALSGIVSQKLARKLCDKCKRVRQTTPYEQEMFKRFLNMDVANIYEPVGCPECSGGYKGRIAIQEVLLINPDIRDAINARMSKADLRNLVYNSDVITLLQDGLYKVLAGFTSIEEIIKLTEADDEVNAETKYKDLRAGQMNLPQQMNRPQQMNQPQGQTLQQALQQSQQQGTTM